jgi:hypothetical protein
LCIDETRVNECIRAIGFTTINVIFDLIEISGAQPPPRFDPRMLVENCNVINACGIVVFQVDSRDLTPCLQKTGRLAPEEEPLVDIPFRSRSDLFVCHHKASLPPLPLISKFLI